MVAVVPGAMRTLGPMILMLLWSVSGAMPAAADDQVGPCDHLWPNEPAWGTCMWATHHAGEVTNVSQCSAGPVQDLLICAFEPVSNLATSAGECAFNDSGSHPCAWFYDNVEDCLEGEGDACDDAVACLQEASNGGNGPCGLATQLVVDCLEGAAGSHCTTIRQAAEACLAGSPEIPCDPNPQYGFVPPSGCMMECLTREVQELAVVDGLALPETWLVGCEVDQVPGLTIPYVTTSDDPDVCPIGERDGSPARPITAGHHAPDLDFVEPIYELTAGLCEYHITLLVYGFGVDAGREEDRLTLPCAFLEPA